MKPKRIQLSRRKGYKKPAGAVVCSRPTKWGNWYRLTKVRWHNGKTVWSVVDVDAPREARHAQAFDRELEARQDAVGAFEEDLDGGYVPEFVDDVKRELAGKSLCCWCRLCPKHKEGRPWDVECSDCPPCHVDILLRVANG